MDRRSIEDRIDIFAYHNLHLIKKPIRGIIYEFHGLGSRPRMTSDPDFAVRCAEKGILYLFPYYNPWSWMNDKTVHELDMISDILFDTQKLDKNTPIVYMGGSMGGHASLIYSYKSKYRPIAVAVNCPACNLPAMVYDRIEVYLSVWDSQFESPMDFDDAIRANDPISLADKLPVVPYLFISGDADTAVKIEENSDLLVPLLRDRGCDVRYLRIPEMKHCALSAEDMKTYQDFAVNAIITH